MKHLIYLTAILAILFCFLISSFASRHPLMHLRPVQSLKNAIPTAGAGDTRITIGGDTRVTVAVDTRTIP